LKISSHLSVAKEETTKSLYPPDLYELHLTLSLPKAGNHCYLHEIKPALDELIERTSLYGQFQFILE
jgi:hypothetical protein